MTAITGSEILFEDETLPRVVGVSRLSRFAAAAGARVREILGWWPGLEPAERLMWRGLALLAAGFIVAGLAPLALIVPGAVLTAAAFGFTFTKPARDSDG